MMDEIDAPDIELDLIAAYTRTLGDDLNIRLDLLDLGEEARFDLFIAFDCEPGGTNQLPVEGESALGWDKLLAIPAQGEIAFFEPAEPGKPLKRAPGHGVRIWRDPRMDSVLVQINTGEPEAFVGNALCAKHNQIEVLLAAKGELYLADRLGPFSATSPPPAAAPVILTFWNSLPAYTPLQALRRWDGAHTGPLGGRHGLVHLLRAAQETGSPIFLLDLNRPASLSALDALGGLERITGMAEDDLLGIPAALPGWLPGQSHAWMPNPDPQAIEILSQEANQVESDFNLPASQFIYLPGGIQELPGVQISKPGLFFTFSPGDAGSQEQTRYGFNPSRLVRWNDMLVLQLPLLEPEFQGEQQATIDGLSLEVRRALVRSAHLAQGLPPADRPILALGGDLPAITWGNPEIARAAMIYIHAHPWIQLLSPQELLRSTPSQSLNLDDSGGDPNIGEAPAWLASLHSLPAEVLTDAAWEAYRALYNPVFPLPPNLGELRAHYAGQIAVLSYAARWSAKPFTRSDCSLDLDLDTKKECILAADGVLVMLELDYGGYLAYLFVRDRDGVTHQLAAPSSLLLNGSSPAQFWDLEAGMLADPQVLPGVLFPAAAQAALAPIALPEIQEGDLVLVTARTQAGIPPMVKRFHLLEQGIKVDIKGVSPTSPYQASIALNMDPWQRFQPGWSQTFHIEHSKEAVRWIAGKYGIEIRTLASMQTYTWMDGLDYLQQPEDPNRDFPPGQLLPFPLAVVNLEADEDFGLEIRLIEP